MEMEMEKDNYNYKKKRSDVTGLDFKGAVSLFCIFTIVLCLAAWMVQRFPFETTIFGTSLTEHLSNIMTEHEAGKSIVVLSFYAFVVSYLRFFLSLKFNVSNFFDRYVVFVPTNFLVNLVFVELAVTLSVVLMVPKEPINIWPEMLYLGGKNLALAVFLLSSLAISNKDCTLFNNRMLRLLVSAVLAGLYLWMLA